MEDQLKRLVYIDDVIDNNLSTIQYYENEIKENEIKEIKYIHAKYNFFKYEIPKKKLDHFPKILIWLNNFFINNNIKFNI